MGDILYSLFPEEIATLLAQKINTQAFRAKQIFNWLYKDISCFSDMKNLPKSLRDQLEDKLSFPQMEIVDVLVSTDGSRKYLLKCPNDSNVIEAVLMKYKHGYSVCISTQVGCAMHCTFCASGRDGLIRDLEAGEMILQIITIQRDIGHRISNVVLMGSGEPLDNYTQTIRFLKLVNHEKGLNIGARRITLSTCGIVPRIYDLANEKFQITLAVSLHAPTNRLRNQFIPINRKYPLEDLIPACEEYATKTSRRITFEYALIHNINDQLEHAQELVKLLGNMKCHVNLIPVNPTNSQLSPPSYSSLHQFQQYLEQHQIPCTIRRSLGLDIKAACGQLRNTYIDSKLKDSKN